MTPLEKFEYKNKWLQTGGHSCTLHSDLEHQALQWCKQNVRPEKFSRKSYWPYQITWSFELKEDLEAFMLVFDSRFYNQEKI